MRKFNTSALINCITEVTFIFILGIFIVYISAVKCEAGVILSSLLMLVVLLLSKLVAISINTYKGKVFYKKIDLPIECVDNTTYYYEDDGRVLLKMEAKFKDEYIGIQGWSSDTLLKIIEFTQKAPIIIFYNYRGQITGAEFNA